MTSPVKPDDREITIDMVDRALNAWFRSPPSDQGLERSMRAALEAALNPAPDEETK